MDSSGTAAAKEQRSAASPARRPIRFRTHLLCFALAAGLPPSGLAVGLAWWIAANERSAALHDLSLTAEALQGSIEREIRVTRTTLDLLATSPQIGPALAAGPGHEEPVRAFLARCRALIERHAAALHAVALFDATGRPILHTLAEAGAPLPRLGDIQVPGPAPPAAAMGSHFAGALASRDGILTPLVIGPLAGQPVVGLAMPLRQDDQPAGLLWAGILPQSLGAVLRSRPLREGWIATLVDGRGLVIARSQDEAGFFARPAIDWMQDFLHGGMAEATIRAIARDGTPTYAALRRLPAGQWMLALSVPRSAIDGPLHRAVLPAAAGGLLAIGLAALLALWLGARLGREVESLGIDAAMAAREMPPPSRRAPRVAEVASVRHALAEAGEALRQRAAAKRAAEEHLVLLLREVDHRAKNALAVALSLIRLAPRDVPPAAFAAAAEGRITAMARAHALLARGAWTGAELRALVESELPAHADRTEIAGPPARLSAEAVQPVAMLLHELASNAARHGALSLPAGRVRIGWAFQGEDRSLRLDWTERGGPPVAGPPVRRSFGLRLMTQLAERQLSGRITFAWRPEGLAVSLILPAARAQPLGTLPARPAPAGRPPAVTAPAGWRLPDGRPPRILVVEDEALLGVELETGLRELGCEVIGPARNLAEALRLAAVEPAPTAAVLDVNLGNGELVFPVADALAARGVPYLLATGYGSAGPLEGREAGAVAVLRKPYQRAALAAALAEALRRPAMA